GPMLPLGNFYNLDFPVEEDGRYRLTLQVKSADAADTVTISLKDKNLGDFPVGQTGAKGKDFDLDVHQLAKGDVTLQVELFKGDAQSAGDKPDWLAKYDPWHVIGPFDSKGSHPPEKDVDLKKKHPGKGGREVAWRRERIPLGETVSLNNKFGNKPEDNSDLAVYLYRKVHAKKDAKAMVYFSSDDTLTVWCNGKQMYDRDTFNGAAPYADVVSLPLKKGANDLLVKVGQGGGSFSVFYDDHRGGQGAFGSVFQFSLKVEPAK
ncbi:MAG: hypothetical protein N2C14_22225, partial [Planctomycetales bacterium]